MPLDVIMPALGMAQDKGVLLAWHKNPGDPVAEGDPLFEVETDKAAMEVEAQGSGFLTDVTAAAGDEIPVGHVVARISETAEDSAADSTTPADTAQAETAPTDASASSALPDGERVIMPALGMAQDAGLIVAWRKAPGDAVAASDILFDVETDKSIVEVEAGHDGFIAALLAEKGEEAPVGQAIAIISRDKPQAPVQLSIQANISKAQIPEPAKSAPADKGPSAPPKSDSARPVAPVAPVAGRILASPKARRLALERGLDLARLAQQGYPQPYHVKDLDVLAKLPAAAGSQGSAAAPGRYLCAEVAGNGFDEFAEWAAREAGLTNAGALMAAFGAASLGGHRVTVALEAFGKTRLYEVCGKRLGDLSEAEPGAAPDLKLRDLRFAGLQSLQTGPEEIPVLSVLSAGAGLSLTLECAAEQLDAATAIALLSDFAGRMEQPLRHLL